MHVRNIKQIPCRSAPLPEALLPFCCAEARSIVAGEVGVPAPFDACFPGGLTGFAEPLLAREEAAGCMVPFGVVCSIMVCSDLPGFSLPCAHS